MYQAPRGTLDILPSDYVWWRLFENTVNDTTDLFGYKRIETPVFEDTRLFVRGIGEVTDIVEKEMYTFNDRGGDSITLRPEGTAPVCRAFLEHGMHNDPKPVRLFYMGPFFRYDRPQAGRYRQLHQFGIESIGDEDSSIDAEVIELAWHFLTTIGLKGLSLGINSIGDSRCRSSYIKALSAYYKDHINEICEDCKSRLSRNPLRLLDCKNAKCLGLIQQAPDSVSHLCHDCKKHWMDLLTNLDRVGIGFEIDNRLVRGLDYYNRTVFEITPPTDGRQSTLVGGGRYDGLIEQLGGKPTPGIGFGMGIERVISLLKQQKAKIEVDRKIKLFAAYMGESAKLKAINIVSNLRQQGYSAVLAPSGRSLKSQLRYGSSIDSTHVLIIGDNEIRKGTFILRDLANSHQIEVREEEILEILVEARSLHL